MTFRANFCYGEIIHPLANGIRTFFLLFLQKVDDALKLCIPFCTRIFYGCHRDWFIIAKEQNLQCLIGYIFDWCGKSEFKSFQNRFNLFEYPDVAIFAQRQNSSSTNAKFFIWNNGVFGDLFNKAKSGAGRTPTIRRVE